MYNHRSIYEPIREPIRYEFDTRYKDGRVEAKVGNDGPSLVIEALTALNNPEVNSVSVWDFVEQRYLIIQTKER